MATEAERLMVLIEANTRSYENAMKKLQASTDRAIRGSTRAIETLDGRLKGLAVSAVSAVRSFARFTGIGLGVDVFYRLAQSVRETVREAGDLVDAADKIGITTDALQELRFAAEQSGSSAEQLDSLMTMFTKRLADASQGSGELHDLLVANGVALRDQAGAMRPVADTLADVADLIANAGSAQDKMNVAVAAFGREGADAVTIFGDGAAGIRAFAAEAREAGLVLDEGMLRKAAAIDDEWQKLTLRLGTLWKSMILGVVGEVDNVIAAISRVGEHAAFTQAETVKSLRDYANLAGIPEHMRAAALAAADRLDAELAFRGPGSGALAERDSMLALDRYLAAESSKITIVPPSGEGAGGGSTPSAPSLMELAKLNDMLTESSDRFADLRLSAQSFGQTLVGSLMRGESAADALDAALTDLSGNLTSKLANAGIDALINAILPGAGSLPATVPFSTPMFAEGGFLGPGRIGIAGEAGPELLYGGRSGISIAPMGGGGMSVQIVDQRGAGAPPVEQRRSRGADGREMLKVVIRDAVNGPEIQGDLMRTFGLRRRVTDR